MLTVKQLLRASGLTTEPAQIKLVRHVDDQLSSVRDMILNGEFDFYQSEQKASKRPFHNCEIIVAFIADSDGGCTFHGVYRVAGFRAFEKDDIKQSPEFLKNRPNYGQGLIRYDLHKVPDFGHLCGRLRVRWKSPRVWVQSKDIEVFELLPPGRIKAFTGYQDVILSLDELKGITANPDSHRDWVTALKHTAALYRIVDTKTGKIYIGSAYGRSGLWNRWSEYAKTGHGGNKQLIEKNPRHFLWSIIRTVSGAVSQKEVIRMEHIEMKKHGSRAFGLNS